MSKEKDSTRWGAWYIGLMAVLLIQIAVYFWITNSYEL